MVFMPKTAEGKAVVLIPISQAIEEILGPWAI